MRYLNRRVSKHGTVRILPMPSMYVIRDLVTDFGRFYEHYTQIKPYLIVKDEQKRPRTQFCQSIKDSKKMVTCIILILIIIIL